MQPGHTDIVRYLIMISEQQISVTTQITGPHCTTLVGQEDGARKKRR